MREFESGSCCKGCDDGDDCESLRGKGTMMKRRPIKAKKIIESGRDAPSKIEILKRMASLAHTVEKNASDLVNTIRWNPTYEVGPFNPKLSEIRGSLKKLVSLNAEFGELT